MLTMEQIWVEGARMARFGLVGAGSALVYLVVTVASVTIGLAPLTATMVGFAFATCVSYFGHQLFSFAVESNHRAYIRRFMVIMIASLVFNLAITWLFTQFFGLSYFLSIAVVTVLVPVANYFGNRFWVFLPGPRSPTVSEEVASSPAPRHQAPTDIR